MPPARARQRLQHCSTQQLQGFVSTAAQFSMLWHRPAAHCRMGPRSLARRDSPQLFQIDSSNEEHGFALCHLSLPAGLATHIAVRTLHVHAKAASLLVTAHLALSLSPHGSPRSCKDVCTSCQCAGVAAARWRRAEHCACACVLARLPRSAPVHTCGRRSSGRDAARCLGGCWRFNGWLAHCKRSRARQQHKRKAA